MIQGFDPLAVPANEICIARVPETRFLKFPKGVHSGPMFFKELDSLDATHYDCIVFSANKSQRLNLPLRRLITTVGESWSQETRRYMDVHTKLFIAYKDKKVIKVYAGSQNLVRPTTENLMFDLTYNRTFFVTYFTYLWQHAEPFSKQ